MDGMRASVQRENRSDARSTGRISPGLLAKSPSPPPPVRDPLRRFALSPLSTPSSHRKSRSAAISFIVQLVISAAITLLNTFNRQKIGSGSHRALSRRRRRRRDSPAFPSSSSSSVTEFSPRKWRFVHAVAVVASGEYRCWRFGNSGTAARLGIQ